MGPTINFKEEVMSRYMAKAKALKDALSTPVLFLSMAGTSSFISIWCIWSILEWVNSK